MTDWQSTQHTIGPGIKYMQGVKVITLSGSVEEIQRAINKMRADGYDDYFHIEGIFTVTERKP